MSYSRPLPAATPAAPASIERRVGVVLSVQGPRANVQFLDGTIMAMPSAALQPAALKHGDRFVLVTTYRGRKPVDVKMERSDARPALGTKPMPKVMVREGLKMSTRR